MSRKIKYTDEPMQMGKRVKGLEEARADEEIARKAHLLRTKAGLTQSQLAKRAGIPVETIRRLEEADYEGNALGLVGRLASVLNKRMVIHFVALRPPKARGALHEQSLGL